MTQLASGVEFEDIPKQLTRIDAASELVFLVAGVTERGPIGEAPITRSFPAWQKFYGGYTLNAKALVASVELFFKNGGTACRTSRVTHCATPGDPTSTTATKATITLPTAAVAASAGSTQSAVQPYDCEPGQTLVVAFEAGGDQTFTIAATAASVLSAAEPITLADGQTFIIGGQTKTFSSSEFADITNATAEEIVNALAPFFVAKSLPIAALLHTSDTKVQIISTQRGSGASFVVGAGTANAGLGGTITAGTKTGTGNVANVDIVTAAEIAAICSAITNGTVSSTGGRVKFTSATTGGSSTAQVKSASTADTALGFDNAVHTGGTGAAVDTWQFDGKTAGEYANAITLVTSAPSNGDSLSKNLEIRVNGVRRERFFSVSADPLAARFIETILNATDGSGSDLLAVTDLGTGLPAASGTSAAMTGGADGLGSLVDADFLGAALSSPDSATGIEVFNRYDDGTCIAIPGRGTSAVHNGMVSWSLAQKAGEVFCFLDPPQDLTAEDMKDYVLNTAALFGLTNIASVYWPEVKVLNPDASVYGTVDTITVPPSGIIAGIAARIEGAKIGGAFEQPAGPDGRYLPKGILGFATPSGQPPTKAECEILFPVNVNPIKRETGTPTFIDGARVLDITGNWPSVGQSRGVQYVKRKGRIGLAPLRHRPITTDLFKQGERTLRTFLTDLTRAGAFASTEPAKAFFVDFGPALNPPSTQAAGEVNADVGLATSRPAEFIKVRIGPDTRALDEEAAAQEQA